MWFFEFIFKNNVYKIVFFNILEHNILVKKKIILEDNLGDIDYIWGLKSRK